MRGGCALRRALDNMLGGMALLVEAGCDTSLPDMDGMTGKGITGMQLAEHNGHTAVLSILNASGSLEPRLPPQQLPSGSTVEVHGLTGAPQHNGKLGTVQGYDAAKGRYSVLVEGEAKALRVKGANLRLRDVRREGGKHADGLRLRERMPRRLRLRLLPRRLRGARAGVQLRRLQLESAASPRA